MLYVETEGSTGFRCLWNLYKHPRVKCKGVYGFQGDLNPVGSDEETGREKHSPPIIDLSDLYP